MPPSASPIATADTRVRSDAPPHLRDAKLQGGAARRLDEPMALRAPLRPIGSQSDELGAVTNGVPVHSAADTSTVTLVSEQAKQSVSIRPENGLHQHQPTHVSHVLGVHGVHHPFANDRAAVHPHPQQHLDASPNNEPLPPPADRVPDASNVGVSVDANGHPLGMRMGGAPPMMGGLSSAFEGLSIGNPSPPPPSAAAGAPAGPPPHPGVLPPHAMHSAAAAHHPHFAHHPHALPSGAPPNMQPQPHLLNHPQALMHGGQPASQAMGLAPPPPHLLAAGQPTTMQMWVPQDRVGAVIGSQGAVIKSLQDRSRATIQVHNDTIRGDRKLFTIVGGPAECHFARQLVSEIIERPRSHHPHPQSHSPQRGGDRFPSPDGGGGHTTKTVYVPTTCVGLVIGRRGETIRDLQSKSGASIFVTRDRDAVQGSRERSVQISGTQRAIDHAANLVMGIVRDATLRRNGNHPGPAAGGTNGAPSGGAGSAASTGNGSAGTGGASARLQGEGQGAAAAPPVPAGPLLVETLTVPDDKVGLIIGKGGSAIRELQSQSGAKIQVAKEDDGAASSGKRPVTITGVRTCIDHAKALIADKVSMHLPPAAPHQYSPPQHAYHAAAGGLYYPAPTPAQVYEHGFAHMPPYPPQPFDPNDPQMRAAMAYYHQQFYGYHAQLPLHPHDPRHFPVMPQPADDPSAAADQEETPSGANAAGAELPAPAPVAGETHAPDGAEHMARRLPPGAGAQVLLHPQAHPHAQHAARVHHTQIQASLQAQAAHWRAMQHMAAQHQAAANPAGGSPPAEAPNGELDAED